jgi:hypothetical protein
MKVEVRYATEFGSSATVIDVTEIPRFSKRFKLLSVNPYKKPKQKKNMFNEEEVRKLLIAQRGNCYVAILTKTRDQELATIANMAPEPSGKDGWVKNSHNKPHINSKK